MQRFSKLLRIWVVTPALIILAGLAIPQFVLLSLVTVFGYLAFGVPVAHLFRTMSRCSSNGGAFSPLVVGFTSLFVGMAAASGAATSVFYNEHGVEHPDLGLWIMAVAGIAAALTAAATVAADTPVWSAAWRRRTRIR